MYFGSIALFIGLFMAVVVTLTLGGSAISWWVILLFAVLLLPLSELAVGMVNQVLTLFLPPRVLPKLDVKNGITSEDATFVVIPSMLARSASAAVLLERLELHYLANPDPNLRFALLTDFTDAPRETLPQDEGLIDDAIERIRALNQKYSNGGTDIFFLFHRHRLWNEAQGCWMGWERKRGKLLEFNRLLRGARDTSYAVLSADPATLPRIRFVITLDADTQMPRDAAEPPGGHSGPSPQSPSVRPAAIARRVGLRGLATEDQLPLDGRDPFAVRRLAGDLRRHRSLLDGRVRRLHGPVRSRQFHGQRNL